MLGRALSLSVCSLIACGPRVDGGADSSSSGDDPASSSNATSIADSTSEEGGSTGTVATCEAYQDAVDGLIPTEIEFVNGRDTPVLLPNPCGVDFVTLSFEGGAWPPPFCTARCGEQFEYGCTVCDGCPSAGYIRLEPAARYVLSWGGELYETASPPPECFAYGPCERTCPFSVATPADAQVDVHVLGTTIDDCVVANADAPETCDCEPDEAGWCQSYPTVPAEITWGVDVQFSPGASVVVTL